MSPTYDPAPLASALFRHLAEVEREGLRRIIEGGRSLVDSNEALREITGVSGFFTCTDSLGACRRILDHSGAPVNVKGERQWGDVQTPVGLATKVCRLLADEGISPRVVVEPTCGAGSFVMAALETFGSIDLVYGVEIQEKYRWELKMALLGAALRGDRSGAAIEIHHDNIFSHHFSDTVAGADDLLVIGNPPWVTNAELGALGAVNIPAKRNIRGMSGLDALTGKSNFDIGEYVIVRMLEIFSRRRGMLAMLCKNAVVRSIVELMPRLGLSCSQMRAYSIDAAREFGVAVDASLLVVELGREPDRHRCAVMSLDRPDVVERAFGWVGGRFVADIDRYASHSALDGLSPLVWRQGMKHDCARLMELRKVGDLWKNGTGEDVDVEAEYIYPLLKGSDLREPVAGDSGRGVIVTQRRIGEDTGAMRERAPKLWGYLMRNVGEFERRRSSIYRNAPPFAIFGIGDYSFAPYKVAISGLHKRPRFSLVEPVDGRPVMLDDTCYFLGFESRSDALFTALLLNSDPVRDLLSSITFTDAKRPYTKGMLMRIDLAAAAKGISFEELCGMSDEELDEAAYEKYRGGIQNSKL